MSTKNITCVALLRGINVGGHVIKMDALRALFTELGLQNVRSYIQSGNIFFESNEENISLLQERIEKYLAHSLGYSVPVCLRTIEEIEKLLKQNPFKNISITPDIRLSVTFLSKQSVIDLPVPFLTPDGAYELTGKTDTELFVVWHLKNGRPGNSYGFLEKKVQVPTTTRFWHTLEKILAAAKG